MKKTVITFTLIMYSFIQVFACELCKSQQPELLQDIAHGTGPQGTVDYIILWTAVVIVSITFILSALFLILPNKMDKQHKIKFFPVSENLQIN